MKTPASVFYSAFCGVGCWMAVYQLFTVICLVASDNRNDFIIPVSMLALYMLLLIFAGPIAKRLYGARPGLIPPDFLCVFIICVASGFAGGRVSSLFGMALSKQIGFSLWDMVIGSVCYSAVSLFVVLYFLRKIKPHNN